MSQFAYHAFLSLATKIGTSFGNHLHSALTNAGIRAFSVDELDIDEKGCKELQKTIQQSRVLIVVFSKDYTSSERCLDELVFILESKRAFGRFVLPVFYDVDPSEVRKQKGCFEQAFLMYEERYKSGTEGRRLEWLQKVEEWKASLIEVADLGGIVLQNQSDGCESRFIQEIVKVVAGKLNRAVLSVALHPVGIDSRVKDINLWLQDGSTSVDIMAIYGIGGIGKSTLAKTAYNLNFDKFDGCSFLADVNKTSERHDGLVSLQRQLLSNVLGKKVEKIYNVDEGVIKIQEAIHCRRILLVLDDVDDRDQLNAVLGMREWFCPGSKIIITTRNQHLFDASEICSCKMYKVTPLNAQESIRLFSWHAFGKEKPSEDHEDLSENVILHCKGIPLALKVLGSSLCDRSIEVWESALIKLKAIPDNKILERLRISYDLLPDDDVQNLFLDIICFFVGKVKDYAVTILDGCGFFSVVGIQILSDRCLIEMDKDRLKVHSLIQDMGREIIRLESPWEPRKRSRVWRYRDSFDILSTKTGTEKIEGLVLDKGMSNKLPKAVKSIRSYFLSEHAGVVAHGYPRKRRKHLEHFDDTNTEDSNSIEFEADAFSRMLRLRILQLSYVRLNGFYSLLPKSLRLLRWSGFHMKIIPEELPLESLVSLEMKKSYLGKAWEGIKGLYEFGIFSTYLPGNEVPSWFNNKSEQRLLTLYVDSPHNIKIAGLVICIVYARSSPRMFHFFGDSEFGGMYTIDIKVQNITKGLKWIYAPSFIGIPGEKNMLTFLCHWKFGKYLQTGDQINVSLPCWSKTFKMKEFGVTLAFNKSDLDQFSASTSEARVLATRHTPISDYPSSENVMEGFMPSYQLAVNHYYLSHPEYSVLRDNADIVVRSILNEKLFEDYDVQTAGSGAEEEDDDDSIFDYEEDESEEAVLAEIEEMLQRCW